MDNPYPHRNPAPKPMMNQPQPEPIANPEEGYKNLDEAFDTLYSELAAGVIWHGRMANGCRRIHLRGWGRWHEAEAYGDLCCYTKLNKILWDKVWYQPALSIPCVEKASKAKLTTLNEHHDEWIAREQKIIKCLNYAISETRAVDIELYEKLCCILKEVQNEKMRVELMKGRLSLKPGDGHDEGVISKWIHDYFECKYEQGEPIDFNVG